MPQKLAYGVTDKEARLLFDELPSKSSERDAMGITHAPGILSSLNVGVEKELRKANMFAKVVDLRNANAAGIAYENRRRIIIEFSTPENPWDPGRTEVQGSCFMQCLLLSDLFLCSCYFDIPNPKYVEAFGKSAAQEGCSWETCSEDVGVPEGTNAEVPETDGPRAL